MSLHKTSWCRGVAPADTDLVGTSPASALPPPSAPRLPAPGSRGGAALSSTPDKLPLQEPVCEGGRPSLPAGPAAPQPTTLPARTGPPAQLILTALQAVGCLHYQPLEPQEGQLGS